MALVGSGASRVRFLAFSCATVLFASGGCGRKATSPLERLRSHYAAMNTCALVYRLRMDVDTSHVNQGIHKVFLSRPDEMRASLDGKPPYQFSLRQQADVASDAMIDPGDSSIVVPCQLFSDFRVADRYNRFDDSAREMLDGIGTDVITLVKELPPEPAKGLFSGGESSVTLRLWVDDAGRLRRYEAAILWGEHSLSDRGDLLHEEADVGLPKGFFVTRHS